jgi:Rrf2 family protein
MSAEADGLPAAGPKSKTEALALQHVLQISRKIDYGLRAMIYLAGLPQGRIASLQDLSSTLTLPREFLAKILKGLAAKKLVVPTRGSRGGYQLARPAGRISFLEVIEAVEGPVQLNVCLDHKDRCDVSGSCTMYHVWKSGQERMLEVYRRTSLADLVAEDQPSAAPILLGLPAQR